MPVWPEQRKQGSETGGGCQGWTVYIGRASEAVAVTEIYSRSVGKPPKGLGQGVTWPGLCLGVGYRMELEGQVARGFFRVLAGDVGDLARVMRRQCDEQL